VKEIQYTFKGFLVRVLLSVGFISGPIWGLWALYHSFWDARAYDDRYKLVAIVQTSTEKEALKTAYLAELLGISSNRPENLYRINLAQAEQKLLNSPLISYAKVKRVPPGALYIEYKIRKPVAYLTDRVNAALDQEGYVIPFKPFFAPKRIVHIYLGLDPSQELVWNQKLEDERLDLAWNLLNALKSAESIYVKQIDLSRVAAPSLGDRRVVVVVDLLMENGDKVERYLLLNTDNPYEGIARFLAFTPHGREWAKEKNLVLDLRVPELGMIKKGKT
jgi:hypothetical protein